MPWETVHERMLAGLHQRGYDDLIARIWPSCSTRGPRTYGRRSSRPARG
jgi:hypothetical protein